MSRKAERIVLSDQERATLRAWVADTKLRRLAQRAEIVLRAADGIESKAIAADMHVSRPTVQLWRDRFLALRTAGLEEDAPRPGRMPIIRNQKRAEIVEATLHSQPPDGTRWSTRLMARAQGVSQATVQRIWNERGLWPHLVSSFQVSRGPRFVDVVGCFINGHDRLLVLGIKKGQIKAPGSEPALLLQPDLCTAAATDRLLAALSGLNDTVIGDRMPQKRHLELLRFLRLVDRQIPRGVDLHIAFGRGGSHQHPRLKSWLRRHPRFHLHRASGPWLDLVSQWTRNVTKRRLRAGSLNNMKELTRAIQAYVHSHGQVPRIFQWSEPMEAP